MTSKPNAPPAPVKPTKKKSPRSTIPEAMPLNITSGVVKGAERIVVYGTAFGGKSTLCAFLPAPLFLDIEDGTQKLNVARDSASSWLELRGKVAAIAAKPPAGVRSVVIDTATVAEEFAKEHVIQTRTTEKDKAVESIEGFGWGKGWQFVYEEFCAFLGDLERIVAQGLNVCLIAHDVSSPAPNPEGEEYIRWEPHLYAGDKKGRGSIRERVKQWADHVLFVRYDIAVDGGKAKGGGTRTIYTQEMPTHIAGSRTKQFSIAFDLTDPGAVWRELGIE